MNGFAQHYHSSGNDHRTQYATNECKPEPFDLTHGQRPSYSYSTPNPYSEQELAESLGWVDFAQPAHASMPPAPQMHLTNEMNMQHNAMHNRAPSSSVHQSGSMASNGTFGSVPIPQAAHSPAGWHSSMDSPNFLVDSMLPNGRLNITQHSSHSASIKKEGSSVAEKKAMRRYSHNAVERRRRDNINEQIQELAALVFELGPTQSPRPDASAQGANGNSVKPNKGSVLRKSVEYIKLLQAIVDEKAEREQQMENEIVRLGGVLPEKKRSSSTVSMWIDESAIAEDDD